MIANTFIGRLNERLALGSARLRRFRLRRHLVLHCPTSSWPRTRETAIADHEHPPGSHVRRFAASEPKLPPVSDRQPRCGLVPPKPR